MNDFLKFNISPPLLMSWLSDHEKDHCVVLFDLQVDELKNGEFRFDIEIAFNPISFRRGNVFRRDYYIGCTGAEIQFNLNHGTIKDHTKASTLTVDYSNNQVYKRNTTLSLRPKFKTQKGDSKSEIAAGTIQHSRSKSVTYSASFSSEERILAPVNSRRAVKWQIAMPRAKQVIRDYLIGNLYLFAIGTFNNKLKSGTIKVKPSDVRFFGPDRSPLNWRNSVLMRFLLYKKGIDIFHADGFEISFKELRDE